MLDWPTVSALPWRQRNAEIEAAVRKLLAGVPRAAISTYDVAAALLVVNGEARKEEVGKLSQVLTRMAPYLGGLCAHDGEEIRRYGRTWRRWNWYGQRATGEKPEAGESAGAHPV